MVIGVEVNQGYLYLLLSGINGCYTKAFKQFTSMLQHHEYER